MWNSQSPAIRPRGLDPAGAALLAVGAIVLSGVAAIPFNPGPARPKLAAWYDALDKPPYTPPKPVIGTAWPVLQALLAISGYRLLRASPRPGRNAALGWWGFSVAMIPGWSAIFFGLRNLGGAVAAASAELAGAVAFTRQAGRVDRVAAAGGAPLIAWLAFANVLAADVWRRNARR